MELAGEFLDRMAPYGLRRNAMYPVYGLAEASLAVRFPPPGSDYRYITVDRRSLGVGSAVRLVAADDPNALALMCEGTPIPYARVRLVDPAGAEVAPDCVGHLLIGGDNVTRGYFRNPEATAAAIDADGWSTRATSRYGTTASCTSPAARRRSSSSTWVKLSWILGQTNDPQKVRQMMMTPVNDEITLRDPYNGYLVYQGGVPEVEEFIRKVHK